MEELAIDNSTLVVTLNSDSLIQNNAFVLTGDNQNVLATTDAASFDSNSYITLPLHLIQNDLNSTSQNILLKNFANNTVLIDPQIALISNHLVIGNQDAAAPSLSFQAEPGKSIDLDPIAYGINIEPMDIDEINNSVTSDIKYTSESLTIRNDEVVISEDIINEIPLPENQEEITESNQRSPGITNDPPIEPPIGKGPFRCGICHKEFTKWNQFNKHKKFHLEDKPFACSHCPFSFNIKANLVLHEATHNNEELRCPECSRKFTRLAGLKAHIMLHERDETVFCSECGDEFATLGQLEDHKSQHDQEWVPSGVHECKECKLQFKKGMELKDHMKEHYKLRASLSHKNHKRNIDRTKFSHKCNICLKSFQKPSQLLRHIRIHTGERPFKCTVCDKAFNQKGSLQIHMLKHNGNRPYKCDFCAAAFSQKGNLRAHIMRVHPIPFKGEETYKCLECPCIFKKLGTLNAHISRMHSAENKNKTDLNSLDPTKYFQIHVDAVMKGLAELEGPKEDYPPAQTQPPPVSSLNEEVDPDILEQAIASAQCLDSKEADTSKEGESDKKKKDKNKENANKDQTTVITLADKSLDGGIRKYVIRQRRVGKLRWHQCSFCTKEFKKPSDLVRHIRIHTREKPFKCIHCFRQFAVKSTLTSHIRTHTGIKKHRCGVCGKGLSSSSSLKVHLRLHEGILPTQCEICGKVFRTGPLLKAHQMIHKKENSKNDANQENSPKRIRKKAIESSAAIDEVVLGEPLVLTESGLIQPVSKNSILFNMDKTDQSTRPYKCTVCNSAFRKSSHLKQHTRMHTGERPFACAHCNKRFLSKGVLKSHILTHTSARPFKCLDCRKEFTTMGSLKRHRASHSDKRPFVCPYCIKTFKSAVACRKHMKTHRYELALQQSKSHQEKVDNNKSNEINQENEEENSLSLDDLGDITPELAETLEGKKDSLEKTNNFTVTTNATTSSLEQQINLINSSDRENTIPVDQQISTVISTSILPSLSNINLTTFTQANLTEFSESLLENQVIAGHPNGLSIVNIETVQNSSNEITTPSNSEHELTSVPSSTTNYDPSCFDSQVFSMTLPNATLDLVDSATGITTILSPSTNTNSTRVALEDLPVAPTTIDLNEMVEQVVEDEPIDPAVMELIQQLSSPEVPSSHKSDSEIDSPPPSNKKRRFKNSNTKSKVCHICDRKFKRLCHLKVHLRSHSGEKPYSCLYCLFPCATKYTLKVHMRGHTNPEKEFLCNLCNNRFSTKGSLKRHLSLIHNKKTILKCTSCSSVFQNENHLKRHIKTHEPPQKTIEETREQKQRKQRRQQQQLQQQQQQAERRKIPRVLRPPIIRLTERETNALAQKPLEEAQSVSEKVLLASVAEKDRISEIEDPSQKYHMEPLHAHQCKYCPKSFRKPSDLVRHIRIHTGERPYQCEHCLKCFTVKSTLDSHIKTHSGIKHFPCHVCGSLFSTKGSLKVHMRLHTGAKPFKCPQCDMRFRTSGHRKAHQMTHIKLAQGQKIGRKRKIQMLEESQLNPMDTQEQEQMAIPLQMQEGNPHQQEMIEPRNLEDDLELQEEDEPSLTADSLSEVETNHFLERTMLIPLTLEPPSDNISNVDGNADGALHLQLTGLENNSTTTTYMPLQIDENLLQQFQANNIILESNEEGEHSDLIQFEIQDYHPQMIFTTPIEAIPPLKPLPIINLCQICGKEFTKPSQLERHIRTHTGEKPFKCTECSKTFTQKSTLKIHLKSHTGERPFHCPHCNMKFSQKTYLNGHVKRIHLKDMTPGRSLLKIKQIISTQNNNSQSSNMKSST